MKYCTALVTISQSLVFISVGHNILLINIGDTDSEVDYKICGHSTVEQATTVSFTVMEKGVAPMPAVRERG